MSKVRSEEYIDKVESLLNGAEAAFELVFDPLTKDVERESLWQRANFRVSLANSYIGLVQVRNIDSVTGSVEKMATAVEKENN